MTSAPSETTNTAVRMRPPARDPERVALRKIDDDFQRPVAAIAIRLERLLHVRERKSMRDEPRRVDPAARNRPLRDLHERTEIAGHARVNRQAPAHDGLERDVDPRVGRNAEV